MHLALYGGSFDPPHNAHLALCLFASELLGLDKLIVSVSNNPFKRRYDASDTQRKQMATLLADEMLRVGVAVEVSGWELGRSQPSYMVDLVRYIGSVYPHDRLTLLVGEDSFRQMASWKSWELLPSFCRLAVFRRKPVRGEPEQSPAPPPFSSVCYIDFDYPLSSTFVRECVARGLPVSSFLPLSVNRYILEHGLYRES